MSLTPFLLHIHPLLCVSFRSSLRWSQVSAWAAHWSPKGFKSSGEYVEAEKVERGGGEISNQDEVDGRVAVVKRVGGANPVPIVRKVLACQRAGAVAVVVVDETGR